MFCILNLLNGNLKLIFCFSTYIFYNLGFYSDNFTAGRKLNMVLSINVILLYNIAHTTRY